MHSSSGISMLKRHLLGIAFVVFTLVAGNPAAAETLTTASGYKLEYRVYGIGADAPAALIMMHGKNAPFGRILNPSSNKSVERLVDAGFRVYVPAMPWSDRWDGTHEDATAAIDALVDLAVRDGKKVVVGGHSMGAMFTILYRATAVPPAVIGKFVSAPGHMLDLIPAGSSFWNDINPSLGRAKSLEAEGKSKEKVHFDGRNTAGSQNITESYEMTPEVYLSFHDPMRLPSSSSALRATSVPVLWTVGSNDPLITSNAGQSTFGMMPAHPKSAFFVLAGKNHSTSREAAIEKLIPWLKSLTE